MSKFKVGDRVVCVDSSGMSGHFAGLQAGSTYIIADTAIGDDDGDMVFIEGNETQLYASRFELAPTTTPEPSPTEYTYSPGAAVSCLYDILSHVPEPHRHKVLSAVAELL